MSNILMHCASASPWNSCDSIKIIPKNPLLCIQKKKMFRRHIKEQNGHNISVWMRRSPMLLNVSNIVYAHLFCCILLLQGASVTSLFAIRSLDLSGLQPHCKSIFLYKVLALNATPKSKFLGGSLASDTFPYFLADFQFALCEVFSWLHQ